MGKLTCVEICAGAESHYLKQADLFVAAPSSNYTRQVK